MPQILTSRLVLMFSNEKSLNKIEDGHKGALRFLFADYKIYFPKSGNLQ